MGVYEAVTLGDGGPCACEQSGAEGVGGAALTDVNRSGQAGLEFVTERV